MNRSIVVTALLLLLASASSAGIITLNWGEQNGPGGGVTYPYTLDAGTLTFTIPGGEQIVSAVFSSTLGNNSAQSTAVMDVFVNSVMVGQCLETGACYQSLVPFTYTYSTADLLTLASGSANLSVVQNGCCVIRLGASTLEIQTAASGVPEPATLALFAPVLAGMVVVRRRRRK